MLIATASFGQDWLGHPSFSRIVGGQQPAGVRVVAATETRCGLINRYGRTDRPEALHRGFVADARPWPSIGLGHGLRVRSGDRRQNRKRAGPLEVGRPMSLSAAMLAGYPSTLACPTNR